MALLYYDSHTYAMNSQSRIPMRINGTDNSVNSSANRFNGHGGFDQTPKTKNYSTKVLSPLQQLQKDYQEKLQLEKERKITSIYDRRRDDALKRVEMHSRTRNKRPAVESRTQNLSAEDLHRDTSGYSAAYQRRIKNSQNKIPPRKPQKLPPLSNVAKARSFHSQDEAQSSGTPPVKIRNKGQIHGMNTHKMQNGKSYHENGDDGHSSPPPNIQHLRLVRERKLQQRKQMRVEEKASNIPGLPEFYERNPKRKLTDFEKWQLQQDTDRRARLEKHYEQQQSMKNIPTNPSDPPSSVLNAKPPPPLYSGMRNHEVSKNALIASNVQTKRSNSPVILKQKSKKSVRQEPLRQGFQNENERKIAELEREMRQKQLDLTRLREKDKRSRLDSGGYGSSGSDDSDGELHFYTSNVPITKPVKVPSRRVGFSNHSVISGDEEDIRSETGFQMKPVLVRRDASSGSSRGTPKKDRVHITQKPRVTYRQRTRSYKSPEPKIREEERIPHPPTISPPLTTKRSPRNLVGQYPSAETEEENVAIHTVPCKICGRKFADDRLAKHMNVCKKSKNKKRKVFDMTKARTQGTEIEKYAIQNVVTKAATPPTKKSNWRSKHEDFLRTVREAKKAQIHVANGGSLSDLAPPPPMENPDYVHCKYCDRKFDPYVAQRHIPRCKDIKSRPKPPKRRGK